MTRFDNFTTMADAKSFYHTELFRVHPDHGGSHEETIRLIKELEDFLHDFMSDKIKTFKTKMEAEHKKWNKDGLNAFIFSGILKQIFDLNIDIEIIGFWIYCFNAYAVKDQLSGLGFWFSQKHKAWIYSGSKKRIIKTKNTTNDNRAIWGSEKIKDQAEQKQIQAA